MSDEIQRLREARPDAAGPRDEVVDAARAALMAEVTRGRPSRRWGRRRVLGLAAPALAAAVIAAVLVAVSPESGDDPARAAALVRVAEAAPRLLVDDSDWRVLPSGGRLSINYGELTLANGKHRLNLHWLPKSEYDIAAMRGAAEMEDLGTIPAADGDEARLFRQRGTNDYIAVWIRGEYMIEAQGSAPDRKTFEAWLAGLHEVDVENWLDAIPERMKLAGDPFARTIERSRGASSAYSEMSVFERPPTEADVLPKRLHYRFMEDPCPKLGRTESYCYGKDVPEESRLLLSNLGVRDTKLYAWPSTEGWVCYAWDAGAGGCTPDFAASGFRAAKIGIDPDKLGVGAPGVLVGIVPDDVVAVSVKVDGVEYPAILDSNGYFFELPTPECSFRSMNSIWLTFSDGSRDGRRLTMGAHVPPGTPPLSPTCP